MGTRWRTSNLETFRFLWEFSYWKQTWLTWGKDLSPEACVFSFINATFAAVSLFFAPLRFLLFASSFFLESENNIIPVSVMIQTVSWTHLGIILLGLIISPMFPSLSHPPKAMISGNPTQKYLNCYGSSRTPLQSKGDEHYYEVNAGCKSQIDTNS